MAAIKARIHELSSIVGISADNHESLQCCNLESEIEDINCEIAAKKEILQNLIEQEETYKAELDAQVEIFNTYMASLGDDIQAIKEKSKILNTYIGVMNSDEFTINRLKSDGDVYNIEFKAKLKPVIDRCRSLADKLAELKDLQSLNQ